MPITEVGSVTLGGAAASAKAALPAARQTALKAVGVQLLSWTWIAYRDKARGKSDGWGIKWQKIRRMSIAGRILKRKEGAAVLRMLPKGSGNHNARAAILAMAVKGMGPQPKNGPTPASRERDRKLTKFALAVSREHANHEIGVDQGRLIASVQFGKPNNLVKYSDNSVLVGTSMEYGPHFDKVRPIFPATVTPQQTKQLETMVSKVYEKTLKQHLKGK
jgi:hypothetical protein